MAAKESYARPVKAKEDRQPEASSAPLHPKKKPKKEKKDRVWKESDLLKPRSRLLVLARD